MPTLVDFQTQLEKQLQDPEFKMRFEDGKKMVRLQVMINDLLQKMGYEKYCVEVMDIDDY